MTSKEALDKIKHIDIDGRYPYPNFLKDDVRYKESIEVIEKRLNELEARDTPIKVIKTPDWFYHCPRCKDEIDVSNVDFTSKQIYRYCYHCGQRLDWS